MSQNQVLDIYGQPSKKDKRDAISDLWKYENEGFDLEFVTDIVTKIKIYKNGSRKFDWSGLSANDSMNTFVKKFF